MKYSAYKNEITTTLPFGTPARYLRAGRFLFAAYGCALLERRTEKGYVYIAVNLLSGRAEALCRSTGPLDRSRYPRVAARIRASSVRGAGRYDVSAMQGKRITQSKLQETLTHIFTNILPQYDYAVRENQIGLAEHILGALRSRAISLAESEVGTGKTHAYLIAAVLAKRGRLNDFWLHGHYPGQSYTESTRMPIVVATSSIALQRAIVQDYIPELSRILMEHDVIRRPLSCVVRKGKENYLCEKRLRDFYRDADDLTKHLIRPLLDRSSSCDLGDSERLTPYMKRRICVAGRCGEDCPHIHHCRYTQYLKQASRPGIDFQITNHNYFLADVLHRTSGRRPLLSNYQLVVIDEAHKFLQAARQMYGIELDAAGVSRLAENIHTIADGKTENGGRIHRKAKKLDSLGKRLFRHLMENLPRVEDSGQERFPAALDKEARRYLKNISEIAQELADSLTGSSAAARLKERKSQAIYDLGRIADQADSLRDSDRLVCWLEQPRGEAKLCAIPRNLDQRLHRDIWNSGIPMVLTSGTLSAGGDFSRVQQSLGIARLDKSRLMETSKPSPFNYRRNALLYLSELAPFPDNNDKGYIAAVADEVEKLVRASHGHAAVLFTSYNTLGLVHAALRERSLPYPIFRMGKGDASTLDKFRASGNGILFAAGALWEGIDIPGDALSLLIIVKLPFAAPDPIGDYEKVMLGGMEAYKAKALVPDMLVKLKQGFGRLIRTENDTGVCAILDFRAREGAAYHYRVLASLPACRVTSSIREIDRFMQKQKDARYFLAEQYENKIYST